MSQSSQRLARHRHARALFVAIALLDLAGHCGLAQAQQPAARRYDVPAGPLEEALDRFARQAGITLSYDPALVGGRSAEPLQGSYGVDEGLARLLRGSGLEAVISAGGTVTLRRLPAPASSDRTLRDVTVTASTLTGGPSITSSASVGPLGERSLLNTPFAITPLSSDLIEQFHARRVDEIVQIDPAVSVTSNAGSGQYRMNVRGFNMSQDNLLFDGLSLGGGFGGYPYPLDAVERVEILKGPSAFLYGMKSFGGVGGTINFIPKRPPPSRVANLTLGWSQDSVWRGAVDYGDRFGEDRRFGYRINASLENGDTNAATHKDNRFLKLGLDWRVTPDLLVSFGYDHVRFNINQYQLYYQVAPGVPVPGTPRAGLNLGQPWFDTLQNQDFGHLRADWRINGDWSVTAQYAAGTADKPFIGAILGQVTDAAGAFRYTASQNTQRWRYDTGQLFATGKLRTGPLRHELTVGTDFGRETVDTETAALAAQPFYQSSLVSPVIAPAPLRTGTASSGKVRDTRALGFVANDLISFGERWSALIGLRHASLDYDTFNPVNGATTLAYRRSATTPTYAVMFKPTPATMIYANHATGLERGGVAPIGTVNAQSQMPPIDSRQIELGAKAELGGDLALTAALFEIDKGLEYTDAATNTYVQAGRQVHRGIELFASGHVTPNLNLVGGVTFRDSEVRNSGNPATSGKTPIGVPDITLSAWGEYRLVSVPGLHLNAAVYYASKQYVDAANTQRIGGWTRYDAGLRYETRLGGRRAQFLFSVLNVTGRDYWQSSAGGLLALAPPRTAQVAARIDF